MGRKVTPFTESNQNSIYMHIFNCTLECERVNNQKSLKQASNDVY